MNGSYPAEDPVLICCYSRSIVHAARHLVLTPQRERLGIEVVSENLVHCEQAYYIVRRSTNN